MEISKVYTLKDLVEYSDKAPANKVIKKTETANLIVFAFLKGQGLKEHTARMDAMVQVLEGTVNITIDKKPFTLHAGETIVMPANIPHALEAVEDFKMLLTRIVG